MALMWQSYALGSIFLKSLQSVTDKAALVRDVRIDTTVATFYRVFFFLIAAIIAGYAGILGVLDFSFHWLFFVLAPIEVISSLLYTNLLRRIEITNIAAVGYMAPLVFLVIDTTVIGVSLTPAQIAGIIMLVLGGTAFSIDGKTHHFRHMPLRTWMSILFIFIIALGSQAYAFKYLADTTGMNALSFYGSLLSLVTVLLSLLLLYKKKTSLLFSRAARVYVPYAFAGKTFDLFSSVLYLSAIGLSSVSQVSAFIALAPLILFLVTAIVQSLLRVRLHENLDHKHTPWKLGAMLVLVAGGLLVA